MWHRICIQIWNHWLAVCSKSVMLVKVYSQRVLQMAEMLSNGRSSEMRLLIYYYTAVVTAQQCC